jgi:hypothetical protein
VFVLAMAAFACISAIGCFSCTTTVEKEPATKVVVQPPPAVVAGSETEKANMAVPGPDVHNPSNGLAN